MTKQKYTYSEKDLIEIDSDIHAPHKEVIVTGNNLTIPEIISVGKKKPVLN